MSLLLEYGRMLLKGVQEPDKIIKGWIVDAMMENKLLNEEDKKIVLERRAICETCPLNSTNAKTSQEYKDLHGKNYTTQRKAFHCSICSCPIAKLTASLESDCGLSEYEGENKPELKWKSINKE